MLLHEWRLPTMVAGTMCVMALMGGCAAQSPASPSGMVTASQQTVSNANRAQLAAQRAEDAAAKAEKAVGRAEQALQRVESQNQYMDQQFSHTLSK